jgi:hypothetical protein
MYVLLNSDEKGGFTYQYEIYTTGASWVTEIMKSELEQREAAKEKKTANGTTKGKSKPVAKKPRTKGHGKKPKVEEDEEDEEEDANNDDVDNQVNELAEEGGDAVDFDE